jgi:hypothetical protein
VLCCTVVTSPPKGTQAAVASIKTKSEQSSSSTGARPVSRFVIFNGLLWNFISSCSLLLTAGYLLRSPRMCARWRSCEDYPQSLYAFQVSAPPSLSSTWPNYLLAPPLSLLPGDILVSSHSLCWSMAASFTDVIIVDYKFDLMYSKRAFVHWYDLWLMLSLPLPAWMIAWDQLLPFGYNNLVTI